MPESLKTRARYVLETAVSLAPWLVSMYAFYWLDHSGTWTSETPHRGKLSVVILGTGMGLSFLVQSWFLRRRRK